MAFSCSSKWLVSLFLVYYTLMITTSSANPATNSSRSLVQRVCSKTQNPHLCRRVLNSDPRSARTDVRGLVQICMDKTFASGNRSLAVIASLYRKASSPETKRPLQSCSSLYKDAMFNLRKASAALKFGGGGREIYSDVVSVIDGAESCDDEYDGPPVIPPALEQANKKFEELAYIVFYVIKLL